MMFNRPRLDPAVSAVMKRVREAGVSDASAQTVEGLRAAARTVQELARGIGPQMAHVRDLAAPGPDGPIRTRLYTPFAPGVAPGPGLVYFHGGGFVVGDLDSHDVVCRRLAQSSRCRVLAVDYRLAPEHRFPAAVEDARAAFAWAVGEGAEVCGFDPARVGVAGDSAGGNLAAGLAQTYRGRGDGRDAGPKVAFQLLIYPWMQLAQSNRRRLRALEGHLVSAEMIDRARKAYVDDKTLAMDPRCSPLFADDLAGVAPAHLITVGLDPLREEGQAYADKLGAAGVTVSTSHHAAMPHGFLQFTGALDPAKAALKEAGEIVGRALTRNASADDAGAAA